MNWLVSGLFWMVFAKVPTKKSSPEKWMWKMWENSHGTKSNTKSCVEQYPFSGWANKTSKNSETTSTPQIRKKRQRIRRVFFRKKWPQMINWGFSKNPTSLSGGNPQITFVSLLKKPVKRVVTARKGESCHSIAPCVLCPTIHYCRRKAMCGCLVDVRDFQED